MPPKMPYKEADAAAIEFNTNWLNQRKDILQQNLTALQEADKKAKDAGGTLVSSYKHEIGSTVDEELNRQIDNTHQGEAKLLTKPTPYGTTLNMVGQTTDEGQTLGQYNNDNRNRYYGTTWNLPD